MMLVNNYMRKNGQRRYDEKHMGYIGEMIINSKKLEAVDVISFDILIHCLNEMFQTIVKYLILLKRNLEYLDSQKKNRGCTSG